MAASILIIEDDPAIARALQDGLGGENYQVTWRPNGSDGVRYAREHGPQLIILDVRLPDGSGLDFCRQMSDSGLRQPLIMLTVQQEAMDKVLGLEMGADDYMTKPYSLRELLSRVRAQLRRTYGALSNADNDLVIAGDLMIDRGRAQVWRGNQLLLLTPTEFRLLMFLAQHPGQVLSRAQILDAVWGYDVDLGDDRTVTVHIRRLREKVELDPGSPTLILTVPGLGYRLVV